MILLGQKAVDKGLECRWVQFARLSCSCEDLTADPQNPHEAGQSNLCLIPGCLQKDGWWVQAFPEACRPASLCHSDQRDTLFQTMFKTKINSSGYPLTSAHLNHTQSHAHFYKGTNNVWPIFSQENGLQGELSVSIAEDKIQISQPFPFNTQCLSELEHSGSLRYSSCSSPLFWHLLMCAYVRADFLQLLKQCTESHRIQKQTHISSCVPLNLTLKIPRKV